MLLSCKKYKYKKRMIIIKKIKKEKMKREESSICNIFIIPIYMTQKKKIKVKMNKFIQLFQLSELFIDDVYSMIRYKIFIG